MPQWKKVMFQSHTQTQVIWKEILDINHQHLLENALKDLLSGIRFFTNCINNELLISAGYRRRKAEHICTDFLVPEIVDYKTALKDNTQVLATYNIHKGNKSSKKFKLINICIAFTIKPKESIDLRVGSMLLERQCFIDIDPKP